MLEKEESVRKLRASKKEADEAMAKVKKREQLAEARCEELVSLWSRTVASKRALQRPSHMCVRSVGCTSFPPIR